MHSSSDPYSFIDGSRNIVNADRFFSVKDDIEAVVFDLDGTLTDSVAQILSCMHTTFDAYNLPQPSDKAIMNTIGKELCEGIAMLLPEEIKGRAEEITAGYRRVFLDHPEFMQDRVFEGVEELLKLLRKKNIKIGIASGRAVAGIHRTLNATFIGEYCDAICGGSEVPSKPDPLMMHTICRRLGVAENNVIGVGDSGLDIMMYKSSGTLSLGVQTSVWSGVALSKLEPTMVLPHIKDFCSYVESI